MLAVWVFFAAAGIAAADEALSRAPTSEELRMIALVLKGEGFAPCSAITLVGGRWSCRTTNVAGETLQLQLSNLDFAVIGRVRVP